MVNAKKPPKPKSPILNGPESSASFSCIIQGFCIQLMDHVFRAELTKPPSKCYDLLISFLGFSTDFLFHKAPSNKK